MTSPTPITLQSQPHSRPGRKPKRAGEGEELGKKPKKANSEIRKQQNRIASRNYREKRKRKLQYLQQLIQDEPNDHQESELSPKQHEAYTRSLSAEYDRPRPGSPPYTLPSNSDIGSMSSNNVAVSESILIASRASFDYPDFASTWNASIYTPPPQLNVSTWNIPPWMPNVEYTPRVPSRPQEPHYTAPTGPPVFAQAHAPSQPPRELLAHANHYAFGSSFGSQSQATGIPNYSYIHQPFAVERSVYI